jgi:hypothetical protein
MNILRELADNGVDLKKYFSGFVEISDPACFPNGIRTPN